MTIGLLQPWFLLLLPAALLPWWTARRQRGAVAHADLADAHSAGASLAARLRFLPTLLRSLAVALVILSIARPVKANEQTQVRVEGIAIQMVVDRSGSMRALDFSLRGKQADRLSAIKAVARDFIVGGGSAGSAGDLGGRPNDLIGLTTFCSFADGICPLTLDHDYLVESLEQVTFAGRGEDGTAIGDGLALAVERLKDVRVRAKELNDANAPQEGTIVKSRAIILLTDGENTAGDIEPRDAAKLAQSYGIRVYTIGVGTNGVAPIPSQDFFGRQVMDYQQVAIDEPLLKEIATGTGGRYFRATDTASLSAIYAEIDRLERTETESRRYLEYADFAVESVSLGRLRLPPILGVALLLVALDLALAATRFRRLA